MVENDVKEQEMLTEVYKATKPGEEGRANMTQNPRADLPEPLRDLPAGSVPQATAWKQQNDAERDARWLVKGWATPSSFTALCRRTGSTRDTSYIADVGTKGGRHEADKGRTYKLNGETSQIQGTEADAAGYCGSNALLGHNCKPMGERHTETVD